MVFIVHPCQSKSPLNTHLSLPFRPKQEFIVMGASLRRSLSIHVVSTADGGAGHKDVSADVSEKSTNDTTAQKDFVKVSDLAGFKSTRALYPMVQPYIDIKPKGSKCKL